MLERGQRRQQQKQHERQLKLGHELVRLAAEVGGEEACQASVGVQVVRRHLRNAGGNLSWSLTQRSVAT